MEIFARRVTPFFISVVSAVLVTVAIIIITVSCAGNKLSYSTTFYFVCYAVEDNAISASSISGAVSNYGGAGYVLCYNGKYYVTVSCYYTNNDAAAVCSGLKNRGLECEVLEVTTDEYRLNAFPSKRETEIYRGNLNTLLSLSKLAYECANALDTGSMSQTEARSVVNDIESGIKGLLNANSDNCFSLLLRSVLEECGSATNGYIYSKNLRRLQIAAADVIINVKLY